MINVILSGCNGNMGKMISAAVRNRNNVQIVAGFDKNVTIGDSYPVFSKAAECKVSADVIIDFSHPSVLEPLLDYAVTNQLPVVIATTGLSTDQIGRIKQAARQIPIFYTANMSLGINLMVELAQKAAKLLSADFDIEIIEKHHNQKIDAPSGTALMLADAMSESVNFVPAYVFDRHSRRMKRDHKEIGIHTVRGGTIVGEHEVIFAGKDEVLSISHSANSKEVFATGSINAAIFLTGQKPGLYSMRDMIAMS